MASKIFKRKGKGKSKHEEKSHFSSSSQSEENSQLIGKGEENSQVSLQQKSSASNTQETASGSSSGCCVGPQTQVKSTGNNLKHHVHRDRGEEKEAPTDVFNEECPHSVEYPPSMSSTLATQPMSLGHQEHRISSSQPEILEVQHTMQMVAAMSLGNQEHPCSPGAMPLAPSTPQLGGKVNNTPVTVNPVHPGSPDEASVNSHNCQGGITDSMPQNSLGVGSVGGPPLNHGAETSRSVDDHGLHESITRQTSGMVMGNHDQTSGNIPDELTAHSQGPCGLPVVPPSSAVNQGSSDITGSAYVTSNVPPASGSQQQMPVIEASPPKEQGTEGSGPISLTGQPTQVSETEVVTTDDEHEAAIFHSQRLVTETVMNNRELQDKLARCLDRTHRVIKGWEHLACTRVINAPLEVRLRCKLKAEYSQTEKLIDILTVVHGNTELRDFCDKIKAMKRMDVLEIVKEYYSDAENSTAPISDVFASNAELIERMATKLDQTSRINKYWLHLGRGFHLSNYQLKEIEYRYNPTYALMEYIYATLKEGYTVMSFHGHMSTFERGDVVQKLEGLMEENGGSAAMKVAIPLDSDLMRSICVCLNNPNNILKNWKHLARALEVDREIYEDFNPGDFKSPTALLFDWIFAEKPRLNVGELCCALKDIERYDLIGAVREHLQ